jgi:hypothetical protein
VLDRRPPAQIAYGRFGKGDAEKNVGFADSFAADEALFGFDDKRVALGDKRDGLASG